MKRRTSSCRARESVARATASAAATPARREISPPPRQGRPSARSTQAIAVTRARNTTCRSPSSRSRLTFEPGAADARMRAAADLASRDRAVNPSRRAIGAGSRDRNLRGRLALRAPRHAHPQVGSTSRFASAARTQVGSASRLARRSTRERDAGPRGPTGGCERSASPVPASPSRGLDRRALACRGRGCDRSQPASPALAARSARPLATCEERSIARNLRALSRGPPRPTDRNLRGPPSTREPVPRLRAGRPAAYPRAPLATCERDRRHRPRPLPDPALARARPETRGFLPSTRCALRLRALDALAGAGETPRARHPEHSPRTWVVGSDPQRCGFWRTRPGSRARSSLS